MEIRSENWELISLFCVEPILTDPEAPWCYNRVLFQTEMPSGRVSLTLEPGDDYVQFVSEDPTGSAVNLELTTVEYVQVRRCDEEEWLVVVTKDAPQVVLVIGLSPRIAIRIGMASGMRTVASLSRQP